MSFRSVSAATGILAFAIGFLAVSANCQKKMQYERKTATTEGASQALQKTDVIDPSCAGFRPVDKPAADSPEAAILRMYTAALQPDDDAAFAAFFAEFGPKFQKDWVREQYWPRLRQHVAKYVSDPKNPGYVICKEEDKDINEKKFFIRSSDRRKSNPPIALEKIDGRWKVSFFSY